MTGCWVSRWIIALVWSGVLDRCAFRMHAIKEPEGSDWWPFRYHQYFLNCVGAFVGFAAIAYFWAYPRCGGRLRVLATVQDLLAVQAILAYLARSGAPAPPGPAPVKAAGQWRPAIRSPPRPPAVRAARGAPLAPGLRRRAVSSSSRSTS
jgi:hypothetical protein